MTETTFEARRDAGADDGQPSPRKLKRRRGLPSGRAVVGGFLVAASAVGVFIAYTTATAPPETSYLVAVRPVAIGQELTANDLGRLVMDLPVPVSERAVTEPDAIIGTIALAPIGEGDLILTSMLAEVPDAELEEVSFSLPINRVFGEGPTGLRAGDRVDVIATYGTGREATSCVVTRDSLVLSTTTTAADTVGGRGQLTVVMGFAEPTEALEVTHAVTAAEVSVVRVTARRETPGHDCHRPAVLGGAQPGATAPTATDSANPDEPADGDG